MGISSTVAYSCSRSSYPTPTPAQSTQRAGHEDWQLFFAMVEVCSLDWNMGNASIPAALSVMVLVAHEQGGPTALLA